jgi:hypothetical protein
MNYSRKAKRKQGGQIQFSENTKKHNGRNTRKIPAYFPQTEYETEEREYRKTPKKTHPSPSYPFVKITNPELSKYVANIISKNFQTRGELQHHVDDLPISPVAKRVVLSRLKYLYGNNLASNLPKYAFSPKMSEETRFATNMGDK